MNFKLRTIFVSLGLLFCANAISDQGTWSGKMKQLSKLLPQILVDVTNEREYKNKKTQKRLLKNTKKLVELSHNVAKSPKKGAKGPIDQDPSIGLMTSLFKDEVESAYTTLKNGHHKYARAVLRTVSSHCISCHTRNDFGPHFPTLKLEADTSSLQPIERAELYAATRQYDRALAEYEKLISNTATMRRDPFNWERAVKRALAISVKVKQNPDKALALLEKVPSNPTAALFLKSNTTHWKAALRKWKKEKRKSKRTQKNPLGEAEHLIKQARRHQTFPADETSLIYYLRATAELHNVARTQLSAPQLAKAFSLIGTSYDSVGVLDMWTMSETYHQACIKKHPHSSIAEKCFENYEENIYRGFSGSGGTRIPEDIKIKLNQLKQMATKKKKS